MNAPEIDIVPNERAAELTVDEIESYRANGFVRVRNIISRSEALRFGAEALEFSQQNCRADYGGIFHQSVNVWRESEAMCKLTLHPNLAAVARRLAGVDLRLWHDQILIKHPHNGKATEFHQDQPYWPHLDAPNPISCWIALCDVPVERGCMTFLPASHKRTDLSAQNLSDKSSLFSLAPDLQWSERVTVPLQAGDCTFHHGRCAHMATPNQTDEPRVAHVVIWMDAQTRFDGRRHIVTDALNLNIGDALDGELFPPAQ